MEQFISLKEIKSIKGLDGFILPKKITDNSYFIGIKEDNIISSFIYCTCYPEYININYCFTLPQYRKRGKSTQLIEYLIKYSIKNIVSVPLEGSNTNSIFQKLNFVKGEGDSVIYLNL